MIAGDDEAMGGTGILGRTVEDDGEGGHGKRRGTSGEASAPLARDDSRTAGSTNFNSLPELKSTETPLHQPISPEELSEPLGTPTTSEDDWDAVW